MADGLWKMADDGRFELQEPYRTMLAEAKAAATRGWTDALLGYLEPRFPYSRRGLKRALLHRSERPDGKMDIFEGVRARSVERRPLRHNGATQTRGGAMLLDVTIQIDSEKLEEYVKLASMAEMSFSEFANRSLEETTKAEPFANDEEVGEFMDAMFEEVMADETW